MYCGGEKWRRACSQSNVLYSQSKAHTRCTKDQALVSRTYTHTLHCLVPNSAKTTIISSYFSQWLFLTQDFFNCPKLLLMYLLKTLKREELSQCGSGIRPVCTNLPWGQFMATNLSISSGCCCVTLLQGERGGGRRKGRREQRGREKGRREQ